MMWTYAFSHMGPATIRLNTSLSEGFELVIEMGEAFRIDCTILEAENLARDLLAVAADGHEKKTKMALDQATRAEAEHAEVATD